MVLLFLVAVTVLAVVARELFKNCDGLYDYFASTVISILAGFCGLVLGGALAILIGFFVPTVWVVTDSAQLAGLRNGQTNFYIRSSVSGSSETFFYYKQDGAALIPGQVRAGNNVSIFEEKDRGSGLLKTFTKHASMRIWDAVAIVIPDQKYEFYVPAGTVVREFNLR